MSNRDKCIKEIMDHAKKVGISQLGLLSVIAFTPDRGITKLKNEILRVKPTIRAISKR